MSRRRRSGGPRRLAVLALAVLLIWAAIHARIGSQPAYCGSSCYGYHATHSPAPHPLRNLHHLITRSKR